VSREAPVSSRVLDEAIGWQLCLGSGEAGEREQAEFARWRAADAEHARAWEQLCGIDAPLSAAARPGIRQALQRADGEARRRLRRLGGALVLLLALGAGLAGWRETPLADWLAAAATGAGEQRCLELSDHTRVRLNSRSAIDVRFDAHARRLVLLHGEILIETAHGDARPFLVDTPDGELRALGTRFLVRREALGTRLTVLQSAVAARSQAGTGERIVHQGEQAFVQADRLAPSQPAELGADAWSRGMLVAHDMPLGELIERLGEYRTGHLGVDPSLTGLRISGSFPLRDSERALAALPPSLPVRIRRHTDWWVTVVPAGG
jgi:transmembrane sensor